MRTERLQRRPLVVLVDALVKASAGAPQRAVDRTREIEGWHDRLECLGALRSVNMPGLDKLPIAGRWVMWS